MDIYIYISLERERDGDDLIIKKKKENSLPKEINSSFPWNKKQSFRRKKKEKVYFFFNFHSQNEPSSIYLLNF